MNDRRFDLICVGRAAVDLYGEQIGGRLEDMQSFAKYLGGSPANAAVGASRLGLRVAMLTRVGDEHNGRFVRETLAAEGVDVSQVRTDPTRLTALVFLGIRDRDTFPLVFYRERCADMGLVADDVEPDFIASRASAADLGHAPVAAANVRRLPEGDASGARGRHEGRARHRLPAGVVGADVAGARRAALRRIGRGQRASAAGAAAVRPRRRHRGRDSHRRRTRRDRGGARRDPRPYASADRDEARTRWAAWRTPARLPKAWPGPASRSRCSTCSARAMRSWPGCCAAGYAARRWPTRCATPTPAARSSSRDTAARRRCRAGKS